MSRWDDFDDDHWRRDFFPASRPIQATGGIKAGSRTGAFGKNWWAKRWIATLESFQIGGRLQRGRSYARQGQVLSIDVQKGLVTAQVQGSRPQPYEITIQMKQLPEAAWKKLIKELSRQTLFVAKLLGGEMPVDIESVFTAAAVPLFPETLRDLNTRCSCPDSSNPCKHIAAVYYLLGEEFDRDPFLLFRLRGLDRNELVAQLSSSRKTEALVEPAPEGSRVEAEALPVNLAAFWQGAQPPQDAAGPVETPTTAAALPKRLGNFPFWRGDRPFFETLAEVYYKASDHARGMFF